MNRLLKEASEIDRKTSGSHVSDDFNDDLLEGKVKIKNQQYVKAEQPTSQPKSKFVHSKQQEKIPISNEPIGTICNVNGTPKVVCEDNFLKPYENDLLLRQNEFKKWLDIFAGAEGGLEKIARSYTKFGLTLQPNGNL
jgi:hypothetical protein